MNILEERSLLLISIVNNTFETINMYIHDINDFNTTHNFICCTRRFLIVQFDHQLFDISIVGRSLRILAVGAVFPVSFEKKKLYFSFAKSRFQ